MKNKPVLKFFVWFTAGMVLLFALLYAWTNWYGARTWKKTEADLRAKGEPTRLEEIIPPQIPDAENFALSPLLKGIFEKNNTPDYQAAYKRLETYALPFHETRPKIADLSSDQPFDPKAWQKYVHAVPIFKLDKELGEPLADIHLGLTNQGVPLAEIAKELRNRPLTRAPLNYKTGWAYSIPHLSFLSQIGVIYQLRSSLAIREGNAAESMEDIDSLFLLRRATEPPQSIINHLFANQIGNQALGAIREGLAANIWNDSQLQKLSAQLEQIHPLAELAGGLRTERAVFIQTTHQMEGPKGLATTLFQYTNGSPTSPTQNAILTILAFIPKGVWQMDRVFYCRLMQKALDEVIDLPQGRIHIAKEKKLVDEVERARVLPNALFHILSSMSFSTFSGMTSTTARTTSLFNAARIAIALERYRLAQGHLPEKLDKLAPDFLIQIPIDPMDGQPMRYRLETDGRYRIWSLGWDEIDGGGVSEKNRKLGDWVWFSLPTLEVP